MTPYHSKANLLLEGRQIQRSANFETMGCTWRTAHWRDNSLAAVDDPLSQQRITRFPNQTHPYDP